MDILEKILGYIEVIEINYDRTTREFKTIIQFDDDPSFKVQVCHNLQRVFQILESIERNGSDFYELLVCPPWLINVYNFYKIITSNISKRITYPIELKCFVPHKDVAFQLIELYKSIRKEENENEIEPILTYNENKELTFQWIVK